MFRLLVSSVGHPRVARIGSLLVIIWWFTHDHPEGVVLDSFHALGQNGTAVIPNHRAVVSVGKDKCLV